MLDAVFEGNPLNDLWQAVRAVELPPFRLRRHHEPECHREAGFPAQATPGFAGPVADRGEGALDGVRGPDVFPVLGRKVIESEKHVSVFDQLGDRFVVFDAVSLDEEIEGGSSKATKEGTALAERWIMRAAAARVSEPCLVL